MDGKLARGLVKNHVSRKIAMDDIAQKKSCGITGDAIKRICSGHVIKNPTGVMSAFRSMLKDLDARTVCTGDFHEAVGFWTTWQRTTSESQFLTASERLVQKPDTDYNSITTMVDGLRIARKHAYVFSSVAGFRADQHALMRWLERQPGGDIKGFEHQYHLSLPVALLKLHVSIPAFGRIGSIIPFGDGLLVGFIVVCSGEAGLPTFGHCALAEAGKPLRVVPSIPTGGPGFYEGEKIGGPFFFGQTYFGPHELNDDLMNIRDTFCCWQSRNAKALDSMWVWLATSGLENGPSELPIELLVAKDELNDIILSDRWQRAIVERYNRTLQNQYW